MFETKRMLWVTSSWIQTVHLQLHTVHCNAHVKHCCVFYMFMLCLSLGCPSTTPDCLVSVMFSTAYNWPSVLLQTDLAVRS